MPRRTVRDLLRALFSGDTFNSSAFEAIDVDRFIELLLHVDFLTWLETLPEAELRVVARTMYLWLMAFARLFFLNVDDERFF